MSKYWLIGFLGCISILFYINYSQIGHKKRVEQILEQGENHQKWKSYHVKKGKASFKKNQNR